MKKIIFLCFTLLIVSSTLIGSGCLTTCPKEPVCEPCYKNCCQSKDADYCWAVTVKNGYFYPQDKTLRCIFDRCGSKGGYWFELAARRNVCKKLDFEMSGSYFKREGKALGSNICTEVKIPTIGLGLKYFFNRIDFCCDCDSNCCKYWSFFLGAGLRIFLYRETNCSPYVYECVKETTAGGMVNAGFQFKLCKGLFLDLFADYNIKKLKLKCVDACKKCGPYNTNCCCNANCGYFVPCIHLGGLVFGFGLGYAF